MVEHTQKIGGAQGAPPMYGVAQNRPCEAGLRLKIYSTHHVPLSSGIMVARIQHVRVVRGAIHTNAKRQSF